MSDFNRKLLIAIIVLLLSITIGYAFLSANLNINGTSKIKDATWDIHFENVVVTNGSVTADTPSINTNRNIVTYNVTLSKPGDFYEFTVDVKNGGTIDGEVDSVTSTVNGNPISQLPEYLTYSVTYLEGEEIQQHNLLSAGAKETYKVHVEFKRDIDSSILPTTEQNISFNLVNNYVQKTTNAVTRSRYYYGASANRYDTSPSDFNGTLYNTIEESMTATGLPYAVKYKVENDVITEATIVFEIDGNRYEMGYDTNTSYEERKQYIANLFGVDTCINFTNGGARYACGNNSSLQVSVYSDGKVDANVSTLGCVVSNNGCCNCAAADWSMALQCSKKPKV